MKYLSLLVLTMTLTACASPATPAASADVYVSAHLDTSYAGALPARNQLALGTLNLAGTPNAVSADQAAALLPLWQALRATSQSGGGSQTEVNALLAQIEGGLTEAQLAAIQAQQLNSTDLQDWAKANGVTLGTSGGSGQPGSGQSLSAEARATRQAENGVTGGGGGGASTALIDAVSAYLDGLVP